MPDLYFVKPILEESQAVHKDVINISNGSNGMLTNELKKSAAHISPIVSGNPNQITIDSETPPALDFHF